MRQKCILLGLVESMNLIDEHDCTASQPAGSFRSGHDLLDLLDAGHDGTERDECGLCDPCDDVGQRGLSHPRRSPQDHGRNLVALDRRPQRFAGIEQMALPEDLVQRLRPHAIRKRRIRCGTAGFLVFEKRTAHRFILCFEAS